MRLSADSLLSAGGYKFLAFPTLGDPTHLCIQTYMKLFSSCSMFGFDFLRQYSKYGVSATGGHLKTEAHKKVADALVEEIKKRNIL
jgi:hypothetical protein